MHAHSTHTWVYMSFLCPSRINIYIYRGLTIKPLSKLHTRTEFPPALLSKKKRNTMLSPKTVAEALNQYPRRRQPGYHISTRPSLLKPGNIQSINSSREVCKTRLSFIHHNQKFTHLLHTIHNYTPKHQDSRTLTDFEGN